MESLLNSLVEIHFYDHVDTESHDYDPLDCTVWGKLVHVSDCAYVVMTWDSGDDRKNDKLFVLVKSAVKSVTKLDKGETFAP